MELVPHSRTRQPALRWGRRPVPGRPVPGLPLPAMIEVSRRQPSCECARRPNGHPGGGGGMRRRGALLIPLGVITHAEEASHGHRRAHPGHLRPHTCLLYTSDAADEEDSVDLGGRRIIKKKKTLKQKQ